MSNATWKLICPRITRKQIEKLDELVKNKRYPNRSEAIRMAIHDLLEEEYIMVSA